MDTKSEHLKEHLKDGGFKSRKFWLVVWTQVLLVVAAALGCKSAAIVALYPTLAGSLIATAALFLGGNVAAKHVLGKQIDLLGKQIDPAGTAPVTEKAPEATKGSPEVPAGQAG